MIYTSSYNEVKDSKYDTISISKDKGKDAGYIGDVYLDLAPKEDFFRVWKNNRGIIPDKDNNEYYMDEFYNQILKDLNPEDVYNSLDGKILLCYENNDLFCHRHLVSAWFELSLGVEVPEVKIIDGKLTKVEKPTYIKEYLNSIMDNNKKLLR